MSVLLQHRVKKLLASQGEMASARGLLESLSPLVSVDPTAPTAVVRGALKSNLDNASLRVAEGLLGDLDAMLASIAELKEQTDAMDLKCQNVLAFLDSTERTSNAFVAQASTLTAEQAQLQAEIDMTKAFLAKYQVDPVDIALLEAPTLATDDSISVFLDVLQRVDGIKTNCKQLVEESPGTTSVELLDRVAQHQDAAFEKLYQWAIQHCGGAETEPSRLLHHAVRLLRGRPAFYSHCKEALVAARRASHLRRFVLALTRGGPNGIPRPIEIHSHDPVRYAGDMLAWVHAAVASEHEYFKVLLDGDDGAEVQRLLGDAFEGVARPLEVRLQQSLAGQTALGLVYQLVHLLGFYEVTLAKLVSACELARVVDESRARAQTAFDKQWQLQVDTYRAAMQEDRTDFTLGATHATMDTAHKLAMLLDVYQGALLPNGPQPTDVAAVVEPFVHALKATAKVRFLDPSDTIVFELNQLGCVHATLSRYEALANSWSADLQQDMNRLVHALAENQAAVILQRCSVTTLLDTMARTPERGSDKPGLDPESVRVAVHNLCTLLMAVDFPAIERVGQPAVRDEAYAAAAKRLCTAYATVHAFVTDPRQGYPLPSVIVLHSPKEIETILDAA
ncbi:conserved oligomeric Golgi complex subunit 6 [Achlya hypogyna]|uniref:Conserved oligomeric Golgi complex subunit 6 n=1 Tax=Achlya hypogyna TaxID=1202772 RepID=A0A1V9Y4W6_ACHHY|nr:conserved oligomeric Golgi complex subunit 6 [Achlya hypogyna]